MLVLKLGSVKLHTLPGANIKNKTNFKGENFKYVYMAWSKWCYLWYKYIRIIYIYSMTKQNYYKIMKKWADVVNIYTRHILHDGDCIY